jgi:hypothetical protein
MKKIYVFVFYARKIFGFFEKSFGMLFAPVFDSENDSFRPPLMLFGWMRFEVP